MAKVVVVTGSSGGVGQETARELAEKGFHVVFACRSQEKAEKSIAYTKAAFPKAQTTFLQLDTGKMASVKAFAKAFQEKFDRLDVLVHNAGSGYFLKQDRTTEDGLEAFFATNYLGPFLLTKLFMDCLKKSNGRVICVSSIEHWEGSYDFERVTKKTGGQSYATSKMMMMLMAFELSRQGLSAAAVNPGAVNSGIWWYMRGWKKMVWDFIASLILLTTVQGCQSTVHAATVEKLPSGPVYYTPYKQWGFCPCKSDTVNRFSGAHQGIVDPKTLKESQWTKLWEFSENAVKPFL